MRIDARGIEIVPAYIAQGERIFGLPGKMERGDCLKVDYSPYDVVYFYRPFTDDKQQKRFEKKLIESLKPGAFIAAPLSLLLEGSHRLTARGDSGRARRCQPGASSSAAAPRPPAAHRPSIAYCLPDA